jgi:hypothetical protein
MPGNSTSTVNSILARCFVEPSFLDRMASDVEGVLRGYDLDKQALADFLDLDVRQVRKIAGFITKVKNGHFRTKLPSTTALLEYYAKEIEVFADFNAIQRERGLTSDASKQARLSLFIQFLADRIEDGRFDGELGLREVFLHERLQWQAALGFGEKLDAVSDSSLPGGFLPASSDDLGDVIPIIQGSLFVGRFDLDPFAIDSILAQGQFSRDAIPPCSRIIAYWGDPADHRIRFLDLDESTAVLIDHVDGKRTVGSISTEAQRIFGPELVEAEVRDFFWETFSIGMFRFNAPISE